MKLLGRAAPFLVVLLFVLVWWFAATGSPIFPTPRQVGAALVELVREGTLVRHVASSLYRVSMGYGLALLLGIPVGSLMGWYPAIYRALNPIIQLLRPISPIAWIPLAILWFGVDDSSPIFLIFLSSFFPLAVSTTAGVHLIEQQYIRAGQNFGLSGLALYRKVILPGALPHIITGMRVGLGIAWLVVVAAEMVAINSGLGYLIIDSRNAGTRYDLVVAGMVIIGVIGFILDTIMRRLETLDEVSWRYGTAR